MGELPYGRPGRCLVGSKIRRWMGELVNGTAGQEVECRKTFYDQKIQVLFSCKKGSNKHMFASTLYTVV